MRALWVFTLVFAVSCNAEAGPGNEEPGQELDVDEAYKEHVSSLMSAISMSEGKSDVQYSDLKPQLVDVHTIAPRIPALKVGMNALGHNMLHVHSDEPDNWSAEILSSGATAGFSFTDRVKGLQKGDGKEGSQWTLYSSAKIFRVKDEAAGDLLQIQDGLVTIQGNKGPNAVKPRLTVAGGADSVPRITLVSKQGEDAKHVSLYNRFGKFGVFSGVLDTSIFHITADGAEMLLTSGNLQPHLTIESTAKGATAQEVIFKGADHSMKMYHKSQNLGFCKLAQDGKKCDSFLQASTNGETTDFISQVDKAVVRVQHKIRGGNSELQLVSQDQIGDLTSTDVYNQEGMLGFRSNIKNVKKDLLTLKPSGEAKVHGKLEVTDSSNFRKEAHFAHNVNVEGVVTMQGKSVARLFEEMSEMTKMNKEMRERLDDAEDESKELRNRLTEMTQSNMVMREKMERMMTTLELMQQTMTR